MSIPESPQTREEMYLNAIASSGAIPASPQTRQEMYLNAIAIGDASGIPDSPQTREEMYLDEIARNGGGGGGSNIFEWDFTSATPLVDKVRGDVANGNVSFGASGAVFDSASDYIALSTLVSNVTIEIDVVEMSFSNGAWVISSGLNNGKGFYYRSSGKWAFANGTTIDSEITEGDFFAGHTMKIHIDGSGKWHIYRDNTLVFEPDLALFLTDKRGGTDNLSFYIGSSASGMSNAIISAVRVY